MSIEQIFVVGSGLMGAGIAQVAMKSGFQVTMNDVSMEILEKSRAGINKMLSKSVEKGKMTEEEKNAALSRLTLSDQLSSAADADLVIEAAPEKVELKRSIFSQLSQICREDAILASNTSSISITLISSVVKNPERFIGMHFFSPVPLMELMEIVKGIGTAEKTVLAAQEVGVKLGKKCIVVNDNPGFVVNRLLVPMVNEAVMLLEHGVSSVEDIDTGMTKGLNHPMGPFTLADMTGTDIVLSAMEVIYNETNDPKYRPSQLLRNMVRMGWLGRKTGKGFYVYNADGTKIPNPDLA